MNSAVMGAMVGALFAAALAWPGVMAYRGHYRSWIYRGFGTRYGALAVGWIGGGLLLLFVGAVVREAVGTAGLVVGAIGVVAMLIGLLGFAWMPAVLVPRWRRELLANGKLYRRGDAAARLRADPLELGNARSAVAWHRNAPVTSSEWHALVVTGMHVRPRLRLRASLKGTLPDRRTGLAGAEDALVEGELLVDDGIAAFVQSPAEDARHEDNWFLVIQHRIQPEDVAPVGPGVDDGSVEAGCTVRVGATSAGPIEAEVTGHSAPSVRAALARAQRPRRMRYTIDGQWKRQERTPA